MLCARGLFKPPKRICQINLSRLFYILADAGVQQELAIKRLEMIAATSPRGEASSGREDLMDMYSRSVNPVYKTAQERLLENFDKAFGKDSEPSTISIRRNG